MVHPGYGFLSENSDFAKALASAGLKFIGPPTDAIIAMGSKSASKEIMIKAGVPCVPGYHGSDQSEKRLLKEAKKVGYPVLIKAVKGGGGKGMKIVMHEGEFIDQLQSARREAEKSFGDTDVLIERYLQRPRHVEVQVVSSGPPHNQHVAISTRDCSVQRRHQKIIEEAPAPHLSPELEKDLCDKATAAARAVGYQGAGTVEFIMDADTGEFFFMEMNVRLQVEHPVSEMVSGIDLVEWQLEVAAGNPLPLSQEQIPSRGHSFEARIYAEDTNANFLPDVGTLSYASYPIPTTALLSPPELDTPTSIRVDTGFGSGDEISVHYDPMIAKVIVHGRDRSEALRLMRMALQDTNIVGPKTNVQFLTQLCRHQAFIDGSGLETGFIAKYKEELLPKTEPAPAFVFAHAALLLTLISERQTASSTWTSADFSAFRLSPCQLNSQTYVLRQRGDEGEAQNVVVTQQVGLPNQYTVSIPGSDDLFFEAVLDVDGVTVVSRSFGSDHFPSPRRRIKIVKRVPAASGSPLVLARLDAFYEGQRYEFDQIGPKWLEEVKGASTVAKGSVIAPMPSKVGTFIVNAGVFLTLTLSILQVVDVRVKVGQKVEEGDILVVLEAMKVSPQCCG
jgi:3-methylcrotonyl-CoA carboxylase alpha subunit